MDPNRPANKQSENKTSSVVVELVSIDPWRPALRLQLDRFPVVIGQNGTSDISISDRWVHATHCEFDLLDEQLVVRDLESESGTFVNGVSVKHAKLNTDDNVTIGIRIFQVTVIAHRPCVDKA